MCLRDTLLDDMVGLGVQNKGRVYGVDTAMRVDVFRLWGLLRAVFGDALVTMRTTQLVRTLVGGSRLSMCNSWMCWRWRGGWRFFVRISLVLF